MWLKVSLTDTLSLRISNMKGSDPLNGWHPKVRLVTPDKVGTVTSCPHVNDIKLEKTRGGLVGGDICGSPIMV